MSSMGEGFEIEIEIEILMLCSIYAMLASVMGREMLDDRP